MRTFYKMWSHLNREVNILRIGNFLKTDDREGGLSSVQCHLIFIKYSSSETFRNPFPTFEEYLGSLYKIYMHERRASLN